MKVIKGKKSKKDMQNILNSKNNITKWGQDKMQFWIEISSKKISLEAFRFYNIIDECINN